MRDAKGALPKAPTSARFVPQSACASTTRNTQNSTKIAIFHLGGPLGAPSSSLRSRTRPTAPLSSWSVSMPMSSARRSQAASSSLSVQRRTFA